jgi:protein SCO1
MAKSNTGIYAVAASLTVVALLAGSYWSIKANQPSDPYATCRAGAIGGGAIGGPLSLVNGAGQSVTEADIFTKPTLLYFGYTFCPDVCPMDNMRNAEAVDILDEAGFDTQLAFISIDPTRDTPEVVRDFSANLHPKMIGLTGSEDQIKAASLAYKTYFKKQDATDQFYLVDHSTFTYLVLPKTGFIEFFKREDSADAMAERVSCFIEKTPS